MELLSKIQQELKAHKGQWNKFGKYTYRSCEDILEAVKPLLGEAWLILVDEIVLVGDRHYVKAVVTLYGEGEPKQATAFAREPLARKGMDESQITGAASSYARKYALNGLFCIDDTKDADASGNNKSDAHKTPTTKESMKIIDQAFFNFETVHKDVLPADCVYDKDKLIKAIVKEWGKLPTLKNSVAKIVETIRPEDVAVKIEKTAKRPQTEPDAPEQRNIPEPDESITEDPDETPF